MKKCMTSYLLMFIVAFTMLLTQVPIAKAAAEVKTDSANQTNSLILPRLAFTSTESLESASLPLPPVEQKMSTESSDNPLIPDITYFSRQRNGFGSDVALMPLESLESEDVVGQKMLFNNPLIIDEPLIPDGTYYIRSGWYGGLYMQVKPNYLYGRVAADEFQGGADQQWQVRYRGDGYYTFESVRYPGYGLAYYTNSAVELDQGPEFFKFEENNNAYHENGLQGYKIVTSYLDYLGLPKSLRISNSWSSYDDYIYCDSYYYGDDSEYNAWFFEKITLQIELPQEVIAMSVGDTLIPTASVIPNNQYLQGVAWESSNPSVAAVNRYGVLTAKKPGKTTLTATSVVDPTVSATCEVKVNIREVDLNVTSGTYYHIPIAVSNMPDTIPNRYELTYDPQKLVMDDIDKSYIRVIQDDRSHGVLQFEYEGYTPNYFTGIISKIRFKAVGDGNTKIDVWMY